MTMSLMDQIAARGETSAHDGGLIIFPLT
jgi:hypothetical protein